MLRSPRYRKIGYDTYIAASVTVTPAVRARAALKVSPAGTRVSHHTAALLWGAEPPRTPDVHVSLPAANGRSVRRGIKAHVQTAPAGTAMLRGLPVSTPAQTFCELAASGIALVDLVIVGDGLVRKERATAEQLRRAAEQWHGAGRKLACRAAALVRAGVDSAMETRLRLLIVFAGLPEPKVNVRLRREDGTVLRRLDLCYEEYRLIVEYDGRQHAEDEQQWLSDINRREELDRRAYRLIIVTSHGIYRDPLQTLQRVRAALQERGARGLPRNFDEEWRRHFGG